MLKPINTFKRRAICALLLLAIALTLAFIFGNSVLSPEKSDSESGAVVDAIVGVLPPDKQPAGTQEKHEFHYNFRKLAHFLEYALLGFEVALLFVLLAEKLVTVILPTFIASIIVSFADESIQLLSGRGSSVSDMWIDIAGFCSLAALVYIVFVLVSARRNWSAKTRK